MDLSAPLTCKNAHKLMGMLLEEFHHKKLMGVLVGTIDLQEQQVIVQLLRPPILYNFNAWLQLLLYVGTLMGRKTMIGSN